MIRQKYIYWRDDDAWLGYLEEFPDYWTQGESEYELKENLLDLYKKLTATPGDELFQRPSIIVFRRYSTLARFPP